MIKFTHPTRLLSAVAFTLILVISYSCSEDFFNEIPGDKITPESHYKTAIEVEVSYLGVFSLLQDVASDLIVTTGLLGDLVDVTENSDIHLRGLNKHEFSSLNPHINASGLYRIIIGANEVLANIDTNKIQDEIFKEIGYYFYEGNLIGLRSWAYFTLARLYGQVAYIPDNLASLPEGSDLQYLSKKEMLEMLVQDLDSAVMALELEFGSGAYSINKHALLGDIQLELNNYDTAAYYLYNACSVNGSRNFKVDAQYKDESWATIFVNSQDKDNTVMTAVPYSRDDQQDNLLELYTSYHLDYTIKPSQAIIDKFLSQKTKGGDEFDLFRGPGVSYDTLLSSDDGIFAINKYNLDENKDLSAAVILYRAADIHLLFAEALNLKGEHDNALMLVNDGYRTLPYWRSNAGVRGRVYLENVDRGGGGYMVVENLIMEERAMELAFEGKRWFDLMRIARRRGDASYLADKVAAKFTGAERDQVRNRLMNMDNWYLPVQ